MKRINQMEPWFGVEEREAVNAYLSAGGWLTDFRKTREFEKVISAYTGVPYCAIVPNGTMALQIALMALGIGPGDKVIVPDFTMAASPYAVTLAGAEVVLVDIDRQTMLIDAEKIRPHLPDIKAIMHVSINGRAYGLEGICEAYNDKVFLVEDACQSLGSRYQGKHLGGFGHIGVLSFNAFKIISTGQGGALITHDEKLYERIIKIKDFGRSGGRGSAYEILGMNAKFTDLQAVIGMEQMKKITWRVEKKKEMYRWYRDLLADCEQVRFIETNLEDCAPWYMDCLVENRDDLIRHLDENGIEAQPFYPPIHRLNHYASLRCQDRDFPNSIYVSERGIWLPSSSFLTYEDIERVCREVKRFFA